ncbi:hypothetical protein PbJCM13498_04850 [Prolixibacter bellariivorans]|uniref:DUF5343 domain-containing protein n=1 Tax=Prolixibacter bellariivorans TaxID=314319 RepID=A0A5M4AUK9_9BACT|nr:DUF5343 domain-containing protein [Prolixibacter bellariivorans]GET31622.1 hypothetical protein PbJCM13498_04850 [Prolixibacter bellariivorans]
MLTKKYLNSVKNLPAILDKIIEGTAPEKFTTEHLKKIGFASSNDRAVVGLLKDLKFLSDDGTPTQRYHDYRNTSISSRVLGEAIKEAYSEIFHLNEKPSANDKPAIAGLFKSTHNVSNQVAGFMANTFLTLLERADIESKSTPSNNLKEKLPDTQKEIKKENPTKPAFAQPPIVPNLRYNIEIHLPATKDIEVYNAIFKSLKAHLIDE